MENLKKQIEEILENLADDFKYVENTAEQNRAKNDATDLILKLIENNYVRKEDIKWMVDYTSSQLAYATKRDFERIEDMIKEVKKLKP